MASSLVFFLPGSGPSAEAAAELKHGDVPFGVRPLPSIAAVCVLQADIDAKVKTADGLGSTMQTMAASLQKSFGADSTHHNRPNGPVLGRTPTQKQYSLKTNIARNTAEIVQVLSSLQLVIADGFNKDPIC